MKKNIIMVVNPISGDLDKTDFNTAAEAYANDSDLNFILYETQGEQDEANIKALYLQHKPERILVAGGDGTIKMVAGALEHDDVILGILPAGSANGLSVDLNIPNILQESLQIAFENDYMEIDMVCINGQKSLHLSDIGLNAELIKNYENSTIRGKLGYALQTVNTLTDAPVEFNAEIIANGRTLRTDTKMIVIANSQKYGTGVIVNPIGKMDDGKFEIVVFRNLDLIVFGKVIAGNMPIETDDIELISCDSAIIKTDIPVHFQIDGEYIGEVTELDIKILHKQMKVAIP